SRPGPAGPSDSAGSRAQWKMAGLARTGPTKKAFGSAGSPRRTARRPVRFWDSSAMVSLLVPEAATASLEPLVREDPALVVWWATRVECISAIARLERDG